MANIFQDQAGIEQELARFKKRKLSQFDQERMASSHWLTWSPNNSIDSSQSFFADSPASIHNTPGETGPLHFWLPSGFRRDEQDSKFFTPPAQRAVLPAPHQLAPKMQLLGPYPAGRSLGTFPHADTPASSWLPMELPSCGTKRMQLSSYSIASQLASGQAQSYNAQQDPTQRRYVFVRQRSGSRLQMSSTASTQITGNTSGLSSSLRSAHLPPMLCGGLNKEQTANFPESSGRLVIKPHTFSGCRNVHVRTGLSPLHFRYQFHIPRSPVTASKLVEQWAAALGLVDDTVKLTLHMFGRIQSKLVCYGTDSAALVINLLGCLWVAAKQEECRTALPTAQKMAALISGSSEGCVASAAVNRAELAVLNLLDWQPLKGWDDMHFSKGRSRLPNETFELGWLGSLA